MTDQAQAKVAAMPRALTWIVAATALLFSAAALLAESAAEIERSEKSLMFAGRCMAQMMTGEVPDHDGLKEMPAEPAMGHLFGSKGQVFYGDDDRYVMIVHKPTHCGVNAFEESAEQMRAFLSHWLERSQSPFKKTEDTVEDSGNVRVSYDGHCTECGFDVHARGYWFKTEEFAIYRVFATKPEGS